MSKRKNKKGTTVWVIVTEQRVVDCTVTYKYDDVTKHFQAGNTLCVQSGSTGYGYNLNGLELRTTINRLKEVTYDMTKKKS